MKKIKNVLFLVSLLLVISAGERSLQANEVKPKMTLIIPVYSQKVSLKLPTVGWKPVFESNKNNAYRIEFVPKEENSRDWKNLISIQGFKGVVKNKSNKEKLRTLVTFSSLVNSHFKKICSQDKLTFELFHNKDEKYIYIDSLIGCTEPQNVKQEMVDITKGELGYYRFIAGKEDLYLIHKAIRGEEKEISQKLNKLNSKEFFSSINPIKICKYDKSPVSCVEE